ncbi:MAG: GTP pyrophosphokinase [Sarcina sp.]
MEKLSDIRLKANKFVTVLFESKVDKGGYPYINHLLAVENGVFDSEECRIVALLHDVLEDTEKTEEDLKELGVSRELIDSVKRLTRREGVSYNQYIDQLLESNDIVALRVKKADLEHNMDIRRIPNPTQKDYDRVAKRYKPVYEKVCRKLKEMNLK